MEIIPHVLSQNLMLSIIPLLSNCTLQCHKCHAVFVLQRTGQTMRKQQSELRLQKFFVCQNDFLFYAFFLTEIQSEKLELLMCNLDDGKIIFPVLKSEINCTSDRLVETSLPCSPAVDQSVEFPTQILFHSAHFCPRNQTTRT